MQPIPPRTADELGARHGIKNARRRLLRRAGGPADGPVHIAPAALTAFGEAAIAVVSAGVPLEDTEMSDK